MNSAKLKLNTISVFILFLVTSSFATMQSPRAATSDLTSIELREGLNAVGYPIAGSGQTSTFALLMSMGEPTVIDRLLVFDAERGLFSMAFYDDTGTPAGDDVPVSFGDGVFVVAKKEASVEIDQEATCRPLHLNAGFNVKSLPCAAPDLSAFKLLQAFGSDSGVAVVQRLNGESGRFEAAVAGTPPSGIDFPILPGDALLVSTQQALTDWDVQVAGPEGGVFEFANGFTLTLPPNALSELTAIGLTAVDCAEIEGILDAPQLSSITKNCVRAFRGFPTGLTFTSPGTVSFSAEVQAPQQVPLSAVLDEDGNGYVLESTSLKYTDGVLSTTVSHFSTHVVMSANSKLQLTGDPLPAECNIVPTPPGSCCTTYQVESTEGEVTTGDQCGNCQIVGQQIDILFPNCPGAPSQQIIASESSGNCPTDLRMSIAPAEATLWTCQNLELSARVSGTNQSGGLCTFNAPTRWRQLAGGNPTVELEELPVNRSRVRATGPGPATVEATNTADPDFKTTAVATFASLSGQWENTILSGSERCILDGEEISIEDGGPSSFDVTIQHTCNATDNSLSVTTTEIPEAEAFTGPLTETQNSDTPFTFEKLGFVESSQSVDCLALIASNGTEIIFGDAPLCDPQGNVCEIQSCTETEALRGGVQSATAGTITGMNSFTFSATWHEFVPEDGGGYTRVPHSITCNDRGDIAIQAVKQ